MSYINNDVAVTNGGNAIVKSNGCKKVGTAFGVATAATNAALLAIPMDKFVGKAKPTFISKLSAGAKICRQTIKSFIQGTLTNGILNPAVTKNMSKAGRVGVVATVLTAVFATPILLYRGLGKLIDKARNNRHARKVDNWTIADKFNR